MKRAATLYEQFIEANRLEATIKRNLEEKMERLSTELAKLFKESRELEEEIRKNLEGIGYGW